MIKQHQSCVFLGQEAQALFLLRLAREWRYPLLASNIVAGAPICESCRAAYYGLSQLQTEAVSNPVSPGPGGGSALGYRKQIRQDGMVHRGGGVATQEKGSRGWCQADSSGLEQICAIEDSYAVTRDDLVSHEDDFLSPAHDVPAPPLPLGMTPPPYHGCRGNAECDVDRSPSLSPYLLSHLRYMY